VLSQLPALAHLDLSESALESVPGDLFQLCPALRSLNLERNARLTVRGLDFRTCELRSLLLGLSRLDYIPNLATIASLTDLSLFSLHIQALGPRRVPQPSRVGALLMIDEILSIFLCKNKNKNNLCTSWQPLRWPRCPFGSSKTPFTSAWC
jgi:hypothetical protein